MKRKILLVQHCESEHHRNGMVGSWTDTELTEAGHRQACQVGSRINQLVNKSDGYRLISSDLKRCAQTAHYISKELRLECDYDEGLREFNLGEAVGKSKEWAKANENELPSVPPGVDWRAFEGAETWRDFYIRISECMTKHYESSDRNLIVVSHGGSSVNIVAWWLGMKVEQLINNFFGMKAGGITELETNSWNQHVLKRLCGDSHLVGL